MILTERQVEIRRLFRLTVLELCRDKKRHKMFHTIANIAAALNVTPGEARIEMAAIPSVGEFRRYMPAIAELKANMGDRWGATDWHKVK